MGFLKICPDPVTFPQATATKTVLDAFGEKVGPEGGGLASQLAAVKVPSVLSLRRKHALLTRQLRAVEAVAIGRTFASMKHYQLDGNKEMIALGTMNVLGSMTTGVPKLRRWYGASDLDTKERSILEEADESSEDEIKDTILVTDGDNEIGQLLNEVKPRFVVDEAVKQAAYADRIILSKAIPYFSL
ncbi:hypothetical protein LXL04_001551 [Taraxacum kok-saghyz]